MAGRGGNHRGDGNNGGDAEFDWIYGADDPDRSGRGNRDPEPTRRIPVQRQQPSARRLPPAQAYDAPPPSGPGQPPPGPPPAPGAHHQPRPPRRSGWSRPGRWVKLVVALLVLWLAFTVAVPILTWTKVDKVDFEPDGERPSDQPGTTYLLVGSDSRAGLSAEERKKLHTGDAQSELTDTILLLHTGDGPTTLISIPRDSPVRIPGHGTGKINSAFGKGGTPLLVQTIEGATGVRIDHYVEIGFGGLVGVVDAVDGIEICPKEAIRDRPSGLNVKKGCQDVDGATALAYARARKFSPISDLARVQQQREVISAVGDKVLSPWSVLNPIRWWKLNSAVPDFFRFGEGMSTVQAGKWALAMTDTGKSCTVPLASADARWDKKRAQQLFDLVIEDRTDDITKDLCTATGLAK